VTLDSWLVARLARELHERLHGARVDVIAAAADGVRLRCYREGRRSTLCVRLDPRAPIAALLDADAAGAALDDERNTAHWLGSAAPLLRGCIVESVHAVPNDRIMAVDFASRSAFGVPSRHRLIVELIGPTPNAMLLRPVLGGAWQIIAAAKQRRSTSGGRDIVAGEQYVPPPPRVSTLDVTRFAAIADASTPAEARSLSEALIALDPLCTPVLAREVIFRAESSGDGALAQRLLASWLGLRQELEAAALAAGSVFSWRKADAVSACHIVRLTWPRARAEEHGRLNEICVAELELAASRSIAGESGPLRTRLVTMIERGNAEAARLETARRAAEEADEFRTAGESIYAHLAEIAPRASTFVTQDGRSIALDATLTATENAAAYFKRYRKARSGLARMVARLEQLRSSRTYWEQLLFALDRATSSSAGEFDAVRDEIREAIGKSEPRAPKAPASSRRRPLVVEISGGAVAHVGRSPKENERITFSVAGPDDYWFHARGVPGAHVVLKVEAGGAPSPQQIAEAAALAAGHSRASSAAKVDVDYTQRKHVRRAAAGKPGLVRYRRAQTILVAPDAAPRAQASPEARSTNIASPNE